MRWKYNASKNNESTAKTKRVIQSKSNHPQNVETLI
jgi:hypothetical protein